MEKLKLPCRLFFVSKEPKRTRRLNRSHGITTDSGAESKNKKQSIDVFVSSLIPEVGAECTFPQYLQNPLPDGSKRIWVTETKFIDNTDLWETQLEIVVEPTEIIAKLKYKAQCHSYTGTEPCYQREVLYRRYCLTHDGEDRYRVRHVGKG